MDTPSNPETWVRCSPSRLNGLDKCPRQLWWKYETEEKEPTGFWAARGLVVEAMCMSVVRNNRFLNGHNGLEDLNSHSLEAEGRRAWQEQCDKSPDLISFNEEMEKQFPRWVAGASLYQHTGELTDEQFFCELQFEGLPRLIGYGDLEVIEHGRYVIRDIKAKGQLSKAVELGWRRQLTMYALSRAIKYGLDQLPVCEIDKISVGKTPGFLRIPVEISGEDISELIRQLEKLQYHIENSYWPQNRVSDLCMEGKCGFYSRCVYGDMIPFNDSIERCDALSLLQKRDLHGVSSFFGSGT